MSIPPDIGHDLTTGTRFMGAFTMLALAVLLAFINQGKMRLRVYNQARWLIFAGCLLLSVYYSSQFLGNFREHSISLSWAISTMFLVVIIPTVFIGNLYVLRAGHDMKPHIWNVVGFIAVCYGIFAYGLLTDTLFNDENPCATVTTLVASLLSLEILHLAVVAHRSLKKASLSLTDSELQERHVALRYTAHAMIALLFTTFFAPWIGLSSSPLLYSFVRLVMMLMLEWLVIEFCIYGYNMAETIEVNDEIKEAQLIADEQTVSDMPNETALKIQQWVSDKHYTDPSLTIGMALQQMGVSASAFNAYLASNTSAPNFRKWLSLLRIGEAKRQMTQHPELTLQAIAEASGYANHPNFTRAFKANEGVSPTEWMASRKEKS